MASVAKFDTWQAADGTNVARFSGGELQVWDGAAWGPAGPALPTVTETTGSPTVSSAVEISGVVYDIYTFNGDGSITFSGTGYVDILAVGGGGGGSGSNASARISGGGGGEVFYGGWQVTDGSYTVTIGAAGASSGIPAGQGESTNFGTVIKAGGGAGGIAKADYSGAGYSYNGQGGGMGGSGGVGIDDNGFTRTGGGAGGSVWATNFYDGRPIDITGSTVSYGRAVNTRANGVANLGEGSGWSTSYSGSAGRIIVRVAV
jgi:hypothetical protein